MFSVLLIAHDQSAQYMKVGRGTVTPDLQTHTKLRKLPFTSELYFVMKRFQPRFCFVLVTLLCPKINVLQTAFMFWMFSLCCGSNIVELMTTKVSNFLLFMWYWAFCVCVKLLGDAGMWLAHQKLKFIFYLKTIRVLCYMLDFGLGLLKMH